MTPAKLKVLIADDDPGAREAIADAVSEFFDIDAVMADDGEACLNLLARMKFDVMFVDLIMPKYDGFAVIRQIQPPVYIRPGRIVAVSAWQGIDGFRKAALDAGADAVLGKPFTLDQIARVAGDVAQVQTDDALFENLMG
jgi:two-component system response regulator (stage 0 sporulation protein A)